MRIKLGILALLLAAVTLEAGTNEVSLVNTNYIVDWSAYTSTNLYAYTMNALVTGAWTRTTKVTFGDGITLDTETGEVELPASVTNMTEVARQFWRAVCDVSGAEQPAWLKKEEEKQ